MLERCFLCSLLPNPTNEVFCCVRFIYTYPTKQLRCSVLDPTPSFVQGAVSYVHILYAAFVALDIFGCAFMGFFHKIRLYIECFNLAGIDGLKACHKYLSGVLSLPDLPSESSVFPVGGFDA